MEEKILNARKNGMAVLLLTLLGYAASIALFVCSVLLLEDDRLLPGIPLLILSIGYWIAGIFLFCGLKVLKPQEALVLTLFGDYVGTLKGQGFYWVNPFCAAVNPAAGTRLSQSGDVTSKESGAAALLSVSGQNSQLASSSVSKKISLKMMTLNNSRQKINDCLGNPVEIGIAVIWRVTDTAKAVFNVDNYKEYLSLHHTVRTRTRFFTKKGSGTFFVYRRFCGRTTRNGKRAKAGYHYDSGILPFALRNQVRFVRT